MKKRLLLLAGILAIGSTTFAVDGTKDFLDKFKDAVAPQENMTGFWSQEFSAYTRHDGKDINDASMDLDNVIGLNLTDRFSLTLETDTFIAIPGHDSQSGNDELYLSGNYTTDSIFGTKLNLNQRFRFYRNSTKEGTYSYRPQIDFSAYLGEKGWGTTNLTFAHTRNTSAEDKQALTYDIDMGWDLGYGFSNEIEFYGGRNLNSGHINLHSIFVALYYDHTLWTSINDTTKLDFHTEVSSTPVKIDSSGRNKDKEETKFTAFDSETYLRLSKNFTNNFDVYVQTGITTSRDVTKHEVYGLNAQGYGKLGFNFSF